MIVVDASAVVQALLERGTARSRVREADLHAPSLIDPEVLSTFRGYYLARRLDDEGTRGAIEDLTRMRLSRHPILPLAARIWELRANLTAYDASYVALAERLDCPLITADVRMARASGPRCLIEVVG